MRFTKAKIVAAGMILAGICMIAPQQLRAEVPKTQMDGVMGQSIKEEIPDALIRCAYASIADIAIIQMQDVLKLGNEARMNAPATVGYNWRWRLNKEQLDESRRAWIRNLAAVYRR